MKVTLKRIWQRDCKVIRIPKHILKEISNNKPDNLIGFDIEINKDYQLILTPQLENNSLLGDRVAAFDIPNNTTYDRPPQIFNRPKQYVADIKQAQNVTYWDVLEKYSNHVINTETSKNKNLKV